MKSKFEQLIEHILNDDEAKAKELFHDIVVEKSREIYDNIVSEEEHDDEEEKEEVEENIVDEVGGDAADDMQNDIEADHAGMGPDMGDEEGEEGEEAGEMGDEAGEEEIEDRVVDLEAALDELKAEFDKLMSQEAGEPHHADMGDEMDMGDDMGMPKEGIVREYTEKAPAPIKSETGANTKSIVAGKNDMGGTTANIAKGGDNANPDGNSAPKAPKSGDMGAVDPRDAGKGAFDKKAPSATTGEAGGTNTKSTL